MSNDPSKTDCGSPVVSSALLVAVLMANNKWRLEMWCLRLHKDTPPEVAKMVAVIMDRQLELEEQAKASNGELTGTEARKVKND